MCVPHSLDFLDQSVFTLLQRGGKVKPRRIFSRFYRKSARFYRELLVFMSVFHIILLSMMLSIATAAHQPLSRASMQRSGVR